MVRVLIAALATAMMINSASAGFITATDATPGLFDGTSGNRSFTFNGSEPGFGTGVISNVTISINFAKADGELFDPPFPTGIPFFDEIVFSLTSPGGVTVPLIAANSFNLGSPGTLFDGTITFDMSAADIVNVNPNLPQAGTFRPVGDLSTMNGGTALGTWTLFIRDTAGLDALRYRTSTLNVTTIDPLDPSAVPAPAAIWAGLAGIGALSLLRRRK